jgi:hypothetical protein
MMRVSTSAFYRPFELPIAAECMKHLSGERMLDERSELKVVKQPSEIDVFDDVGRLCIESIECDSIMKLGQRSM